MVNVEDARRSTLAAHATRRDAYLRAREDEKERRKRDALRRIAPGFDPNSTPLVPTRGPSTTAVSTSDLGSPPRSVMDDLVSQLAALDSVSSTSAPHP